MPKDFKKIVQNISSNPGVYLFRNVSGSILYIGKATNLKSRVSSYFRSGAEGRLVQRAVGLIAKIEVKETESVLEALILEANLVKKYQPKYNVELKDDKSFSYAVITKEEFPRILIVRKTDLSCLKLLPPIGRGQGEGKIYSKIFGPYISKKQLEIALKIIKENISVSRRKTKNRKRLSGLSNRTLPGTVRRSNFPKRLSQKYRQYSNDLERQEKKFDEKTSKRNGKLFKSARV